MLVLQRKIGESILIGDDIELLVIDISADKVKLALQAPRSVSILRKELREAADTNLEAAHISKQSVTELQKLLNKEEKE